MASPKEFTLNKGKCLCEGVQFSVIGSFGEVRYCHCSQCRRVTGSAFSANAKISIESWRINSGEALIREYENKPGIYRAFCSICGTPVYSKLQSDPQNIRVRLGSFETVKEVDITGHVWVSSKAPWYSIEGNLPCYMEAIEN